MKIVIAMSTRDKSAYADGLYCKEKTVVKAGGRISSVFRGYEKIAMIRNNRDLVDAEGTILKDCEFATPSEAAQFVNGSVTFSV